MRNQETEGKEKSLNRDKKIEWTMVLKPGGKKLGKHIKE
jgi:hypothetical protein